MKIPPLPPLPLEQLYNTFPASRLLALTSSSSCCTFLYLDSHLIQTVLQVFDSHLHVLLHPLQVSTGSFIKISLHLLFDSQGIISASDLRVQSALHGIYHSLAVPLDLFHLLVLFGKLPVNLTLHLVQLQLHTKNLGLFMLQGAL
uniref:Uncharacterized protein n=1 Tax=Sinocyclocheilus rhinocerous TaxID=307959 RepID=A0A673GKB3_9TELE